MQNKQNKAVTYNATVTNEKLSVLSNLVNVGKNASVLLTIGKAMMKGNELPTWAKAMPLSHFENVFNLSERSLAKVCNTDSYHDLRAMINTHLKGEVIKTSQAESLDKIMTIKSFQDMSVLKEIKMAYVAHTQTKHLLNVISFMTGAHDTSVPNVEVKQIDLSALTDTLNNLDESQALLMLEVLQGRLNVIAQTTEQVKTKKAA